MPLPIHPPLSAPTSMNPFPRPVPVALRNGIPLYVVENRTLPYVSLQLVLRSGACHDGVLPGLAEFTSTMLLSGAGVRDARKFAEDIEYLGASLDASAGLEEIIVRLGLLGEHLPAGLDLMADMVLRPRFAAREIKRQRNHSIAAVQQNMTDPGYVAMQRFRHELFGDSAYGTEIEGTESSLRNIDRAECAAFHHRHFTAGNAFFVAAGDIEAGALAELLDGYFGDWTGERSEDCPDPERMAGAGRVVSVSRPDAAQSAVIVGGHGVARRDPDYAALTAANAILGGYFNSRINMNLRERNGFTYGARSFIDAPTRPGLFAVTASVGAAVTMRAVEEITNELAEISRTHVSEQELSTVKSYMAGSLALQMETPGQVARAVRGIVFHELPPDYYDLFLRETESLSPDDLLRAAQRVMQPEGMVTVIVGDWEKGRAQG